MSTEDEIFEQSMVQTMQSHRASLLDVAGIDPIAQIEMVYRLWWRWADFHLFVTAPVIQPFRPPHLIPPAHVEENDEYEFVYPIVDYGDRFSTSKGLEIYSTGLSMCKLFCTIEKMVNLLMLRLKSGGVQADTEVQVAFAGHELAQRKGFESIINLSYNIVITNFDPGVWGDRYLQTVKRLVDRGYGYPAAAPRDSYRHAKMTGVRG